MELVFHWEKFGHQSDLLIQTCYDFSLNISHISLIFGGKNNMIDRRI